MKSVKKNKEMRRAFGVAALVIVTLSLLGGTLAKYTKEGNVEDSARVAKFSVTAEGDTDHLFSATGMYDNWTAVPTFDASGGIDNKPNLEDSVESKKNPKDKVLAPGTSGYAVIEVGNTASEVDVDYKTSLTITNAGNIPLEYSYAAGEKGTQLTASAWSSTPPTAGTINGTIAKGTTENHEVYIFWRWAFEKGNDDAEIALNDAADTTLGEAGTATVNIKATTNVTQVD
ncbi:hypothetical protein [Enterococcus sp. CSURQ0835]|uniref:hypothetical protein n=1 Tax=Enterococcus sp. CSURQ0835 TaxID=2681394 RepID=UPI00135A6225|nr:hypothetical protein [Enterococcus sp. CSURQ0835]